MLGSTGKRVLWVTGSILAALLHAAVVGVAFLVSAAPAPEEDAAAGSFVVELAPVYTTAAVPDTNLPVGALSGEAAESAAAAAAKPSEVKPDEPIAEPGPTDPELAVPLAATRPETKPQPEPEPTKDTETRESAASAAAQAAAPPKIEAPEAKAPTAPEVGLSPHAQRVKTSWLKSLALHLERFKRYPEAARAQHASGTAVVQFVIDRDGHVTTKAVGKSSGSSVLDEAALDLLQRAMPLPKTPNDVPGEQFTLSVPIVFKRDAAGK